MTQVTRWGILGAAKFALEHMGPAIHEAQDAKLVALATSSAEKARPFMAFCPDIEVCDSYEALLARDDIDAVYVPLPNHIHIEWSRKALEAGKHVLCEKPIAMRAEDIDDLIALRDQTGLLAAEAYMIVHHPQWRRARDLVQGGAIGDLVHVQGHFSYDNSDDPGNIRNHPQFGGGGIRDIGVYPYGATRFVTGQEPVTVRAVIERENGVDTYAQVSADFEGFRGAFTTSMRMSLWQEMTFHGTKAIVRVHAPFNAGTFGESAVELRSSDGRRQIDRFPDVRQYKLQVEAFGRSVQTGVPYPCPLEFSRGTQRMIDMVFDAGHERRSP
ncbi:Gfo/Idh/MocA family oxidoreductase [Aliiroseovarius subalbicans]|uniref:Gfo/Idh/MocA family protein n=1 Tax=Aliiroseovarius subalbicans TaxID=2925840 RepID=UPI001F57BFEF|nr:Gfo/Idh/MocA family oxidoreductase [Aliiroseovarius subalbicans]MCI2398558.1 Gfo/Idh/MocA family oxidoreductase [Aliiroseovarius subalbicans]